MKIVFYSSNSNIFDKENFFITTLPSHFQKWKEFIKNHPEDEFYFVTEQPGMFILDSFYLGFITNPKNGRVKGLKVVSLDRTYFDEDEVCKNNLSVENLLKENNIFVLQENSCDLDIFAQKIMSFNPDFAISMSFWVNPFDWLPVQDSLIAEKLESNGIKVISHPAELNYNFFDKNKTKQILEKNGFLTPKGIYVNHDMYFCAGNRKEIKKNVYKDYILNQIKKLNFPLIAKDPFGLSSYGMQVLNTYGEVCNYLNSKKNNSDRIIEEMISGNQFGIEFLCCNAISNTKTISNEKSISIFPPFMFSVNKYGITSPKQSIKIGPIKENSQKNDFCVKELYDLIKKLAQTFDFNGIAQVDLVLHEKQWYIIEINPRLSGMTLSSLSFFNDFNNSIFEVFYNHFVLKNQTVNESINKISNSEAIKCINLKLPLLSKDDLLKLKNLSFVKYVCQTENKSALQEREKGFCEVIICGESACELQSYIVKIEKDFSTEAEKSLFINAKEMLLLCF